MTERWHLNCFNLSEVIVVRDGPDAQGRRYVDGRHQVSIAKFDTVEQAREFCAQHNSELEVKEQWPQDAIDQEMIERVRDDWECPDYSAPNTSCASPHCSCPPDVRCPPARTRIVVGSPLEPSK